jgi:hypothetical protein
MEKSIELVDIVLRVCSIREQRIDNKAARTALHNDFLFRFDWQRVVGGEGDVEI